MSSKPRYIIKEEGELTHIQKENMKQRLMITERCLAGSLPTASAQELEYLRKVRQACKDDIFFWLENFARCFDPNERMWLPFIPYEFQVEVIDLMVKSINGDPENSDKPFDLLIEKSRDMGLTWCVCFVYQWFWQFHRNCMFHIGSKKEDNVDKVDDPSSIMMKIRGSLERQPGFLMPPDFNIKKDCPHLKLVNTQTGSIITGESCNPAFARSGRYKSIFFDEFAFWDNGNDAAAWNSAGDSTRSRIAVSTPYGKYNKFASLRFGGQIHVFTAHWTQHPDKDEEWYKDQCARREPYEIAQELDINYVASMEGAIYNEFDPIRHISQDTKKEFPTLKHLTRVWDEGLSGAVLFCAKQDKTAIILDEYVYYNTVDDDLAANVIAYTNEHFKDWTVTDEGDIAGKKRNRDDKDSGVKISFFDVLRKTFGINIREKHRGLVEDGIKVVKGKLFRPDEFRVDCKCTKTIEALYGAYRRKTAPAGSNRDMPPAQEHPFEDVMDCMRYYIVDNFSTNKRVKKGSGSRKFKKR